MPFYPSNPSTRIDGVEVTTDQWNAEIANNIAALAATRGARLVDDANLALLSGAGNSAFLPPPVIGQSWYTGGAQTQIQFQGDILPANQGLNTSVNASPTALLYFRYPGKYLVEAEAYFGANATGYRLMQVQFIWPATVKSIYETDGGHATEQTILHSATVVQVAPALTQTNLVQVLLLQNSGSTLSVGGRVGVQYLGD